MAFPSLVCPLCRSSLHQEKNLVRCPNDGKSFTYQDGILCFGSTDDFYESRFTETRDDHHPGSERLNPKTLLKWINRRVNIGGYEARFFCSQMKRLSLSKHQQILDFGCGGGSGLLAAYGSVTGVDLSLGSLLQARKIYSHVYQIDGLNLPFSDASFDIVYTSHVFGHIPATAKACVIAEIYRVLKPGGFLIGSIECDSHSLIYRRAKKDAALFAACFVEPWGHHGLEMAAVNFQRFREAGFIPVIECADIHKGYLRPIASYSNLLLYKRKDRLLYSLAMLSCFVSKSRPLTTIIDILFGMLLPIAYLFTPPDHRDSAKVVYRRPV